MGQKDKTEKYFEEIPSVFADIFNVFLFEGEQVVLPEDLSPATARSQLKMGNKVHEEERDVAKFWTHNGTKIRLCLYGIENQSAIDSDIALRCIAYDGAEYKRQVVQHNDPKEKSLSPYPVITIVLYFGEEPWTGSKTLMQRFGSKIDKRLLPYINDYKATVITLQDCTQQDIDRCRTDLRHIIDFCVQRKQTGTYRPNADIPLDYPEQLLKLMAAFTQDHRFEVEFKETHERKEVVYMCGIIDKYIAQGRAEGLAEGRAEGEAKGCAEGTIKGQLMLICDLVFDGLLELPVAIARGFKEADILAQMRISHPDWNGFTNQ